MKQLNILENWIRTHDEAILSALNQDLGKSRFEGYATEVGLVLDEIRYIRKNLPRWLRDKPVRSPLKQFPSKCFIRPQAYGRVLIISAWNYPFQLSIMPLVGAIAAGNTVVIKPSEYSPATNAIIDRMISDCFTPDQVKIELNEDIQKSQYFDYIFFTGSVRVGKIIMAAAAESLTPVTLELGGKCPCIVDETANIKLSAKRITWGKFLNSGQSCVAPDYLFIQHSVKDKFIEAVKECISADYLKIINKLHFNRIVGLMEGEKIAIGGGYDAEKLTIEPTLLDNVNTNSPIMSEEIFGPVLPLLCYQNLDEAVKHIKTLPKPLACYIFSENKERQEYLLNILPFGGGCINDTMVHLSVSGLPFGGLGESGLGAYHGKASFDTFTHYKSIVKKSSLIDLPFRYPPNSELILKLLKKLRI